MECPFCGKTVAELAGGICAECASQRRPFLTAPDVADVVRCAHCQKVQIRGVWKRAGPTLDDLVWSVLRDETDVDPSLGGPDLRHELGWEDDRNAMATLRLSGSFHGNPVDREAQVRVRIKQSVCPDCSREYGGYFEAIVQVRAEAERVLEAESDQILRWIRLEMDRYRGQDRPGAFLSRTERVRGGFDLYAGSHEIAKLLGHSIAERYGATTTESSKLVGRKDGRDLTRTTLLVRLPAFLPGDFIRSGDRLYKVLRHEKKRLTLWDLERNESLQRELRFLKDLKVVGTAQDEREAVVVSRHDRQLQVLDPVSLKTVDLEVERRLPETPTVRVFRHEDRLFLLPERTEVAS